MPLQKLFDLKQRQTEREKYTNDLQYNVKVAVTSVSKAETEDGQSFFIITVKTELSDRIAEL
jgi:hypothetical protein